MSGTFGWMRSTTGKKAQMAVSGVFLFGFAFAHMAGNLKVFQGPEKFNAYAEYIRVFGEPLVPQHGFLWISRIGLLALIVVHGVLAFQLSRQSQAARPQPYKQSPDLGFSYASRTMRWGGVIVATFIVYHLLHLTVGIAHSDFRSGDAYHNLVAGLSNPLVALSYVVSVTALAAHLYHGLWSATQTLGVTHDQVRALRRPVAAALAAITWLGYLAIPISVQLGILAQ